MASSCGAVALTSSLLADYFVLNQRNLLQEDITKEEPMTVFTSGLHFLQDLRVFARLLHANAQGLCEDTQSNVC